MRRLKDPRFLAKLKMTNGRWKPRILYLIQQHRYRFNTIKNGLGKISNRALSNNLKDLVDVGLVNKVGLKYSLTPHGGGMAILADQGFSIVDDLELRLSTDHPEN